MSLIVASRKSSALPGLLGRILNRLCKARPPRPRLRRVDIAEFSPHLQRDMGFLDGHRLPDRDDHRSGRDPDIAG
jgi:hypothetical protein